MVMLRIASSRLSSDGRCLARVVDKVASEQLADAISCGALNGCHHDASKVDRFRRRRLSGASDTQSETGRTANVSYTCFRNARLPQNGGL
jgi:hypothetical protein